VTSFTANGTYGSGSVLTLKVAFSEPVVVDVTGGTPRLQLALGSGVPAIYAGGSGTASLSFTYAVVDGDSSTDLDYTATTALSANGGTIKDAAGNTAVLTLVSPGTAGSLAANAALVIDTVGPVVTGVDSSALDGIYGVGAILPIVVTFDKAVVVTGTPQLTLETGLSDAVVNYNGGTGSKSLTFTYTVAAGQVSTDLEYDGISALGLNGGTIKSSTGNVASTSLPTPGTTGSLSVNRNLVIDTAADTVAPTVVSVDNVTSDGSYAVGDTITISVKFSERVSVSGAPFVVLNDIGSSHTTPQADYAGGSGTDTLTFDYLVLDGHTTDHLDYAGTNSLRLNGGTIGDVTNAAVLTLPAPGAVGSLAANSAIAIDPQPTGGKPPPDTAITTESNSGGCGLGGGAALIAGLALFLRGRRRLP
jgi:hypothetical protein